MSVLFSIKFQVKYCNVIRQIARHQSIFRARKALLYVPGDDEKKIKKATQLNADLIALDCEDGVALNRKNVARETIRNFFHANEIQQHSRSEWAVRLNSRSSELLDEDLQIIMSAKQPPETILLPKCESPDDIKYLSDKLAAIVKSNSEPLKLIFFIESCRSLISLVDICRTANETRNIKPVAIVFGSDDFCASVGVTRTEDSQEILYARQKVVTVAKAFDLQAIDMVYIQFKDLVGLRVQCEAGARMGYTGKQIIHPGQIDIVQKAFLPSEAKIKWATGLIDAFNEHQNVGKGAFVYKNQMIDMPTVKQALNVINLIQKVKE